MVRDVVARRVDDPPDGLDVVSTSPLRAATIARDLGSDAQVVGPSTASHYVASAFLRDFDGVVVRRRLARAVALPVPFAAGTAFLVLAAVASSR